MIAYSALQTLMKEEGPGTIEQGAYIEEHAVFVNKSTENNLRVFTLARVETVDM